MIEIPRFQLYKDGDPVVQESIQPRLELRGWCDLDSFEKSTALQALENDGWLNKNSEAHLLTKTISQLNNRFLRVCPGKRLHSTPYRKKGYITNNVERETAAIEDFREIWLESDNEELVYTTISLLLKATINEDFLELIVDGMSEREVSVTLKKAYYSFDRMSAIFNHIFAQFSVNLHVSRVGLLPQQDIAIYQRVYEPVMLILSDRRWRPLNDDLESMFELYSKSQFADVITAAHRALQRFLQLIVTPKHQNGKGEVGKLFSEARDKGLIGRNIFVSGVIAAGQSYLASERAQKSTAKPPTEKATQSDAMLVMNVTLVLIQYILQNIRGSS